jgi:hypothetical protein
MSAYDPNYKHPSPPRESNELTENDLKKMRDYLSRRRDPKHIAAWREKYIENGHNDYKKSPKELESMRAQQLEHLDNRVCK